MWSKRVRWKKKKKTRRKTHCESSYGQGPTESERKQRRFWAALRLATFAWSACDRSLLYHSVYDSVINKGATDISLKLGAISFLGNKICFVYHRNSKRSHSERDAKETVFDQMRRARPVEVTSVWQQHQLSRGKPSTFNIVSRTVPNTSAHGTVSSQAFTE